MKKTVYVITRAHNDYDQHGDYLVSVFLSYPTEEQLLELFPNSTREFAEHVLQGGGRVGTEDEWYYLTPLVAGTEYINK
jgi:hypothetical protein